MHSTRIALGVLLLLLCWSRNLFAQSFTYQGFLKASGVPASAQYDFRFRLYTALTGGTQVGSDLLVNDLSVQNGLFTAELNFGSVWDGSDRYLEIAVRPGSSTGAYTALSPRVKITSTPYAVFAQRPWQTSGSDIFYNAGNVGIGTNSPFYPLHVEGSDWAVYGRATSVSSSTIGVTGRSDGSGGKGVYGLATTTSGAGYGVYGENWGIDGSGVFGSSTASTGPTVGVLGRSNSTSGKGVVGEALASSGTTYGVYGWSGSTSGTGVFGWASSALSGFSYGIYGRSDSTAGTGVSGWATASSGVTYGVWGRSDSPQGRAVFGWADATSGTNYGVYGATRSPSGYAGFFDGRFAATGTKSFQIDHPLSPENAYLNHFCTEGPEPYNAYSGNVVTDAQGYAVVQLPDYFESINRDFRYQLTVIDGSDDFVLAKVVREIQNNQFVIRTNKPHVKVSWEVKAIRNDRWVQEYGYQTEQPKPAEHQGRYLHPELYGQPKELGIHYRPTPEREVRLPNR